jgi:hypothetical protein
MSPRCNRCSRPLKDPESIYRGLGRVCAGKVGLSTRRIGWLPFPGYGARGRAGRSVRWSYWLA